MRENRAKHKLREKKRIAVALGGPDHTSDMADFLGSLGFDAVRFCMEHGQVAMADLSDMSRACDLWGMSSLVRVNANEPWLIGRTLDRGIQGVIVPHVNTRDEALRLVDGAKFAPIGHRGVAGNRQGYGVADYLQQANDETIVVAMVEDVVAIRNLADILTVDHIDVFIVARNDLAHSMGYLGQSRHPEVEAVFDKTVAQIIAAGRTAGVQVTDSDVDKYIDMGVGYLAIHWSNWVKTGAAGFVPKVTKA